MISRVSHSLKFASALAVLCMLTTQQAGAQVLDQITVTAQKRSESLKDVPISITAIDGKKMRDVGIQRIEDLATYVPNFSVIQEPLGDKINIRGIQSGTLAGFEQSVATFVDDIYRGRSSPSRWAFLDVERVEILRGPQPTLFGKNTVAGAVNIVTARPTDEIEGELSVAIRPEFDATEIQAYLSGPFGDRLRGRLTLLSHEMDEGWVGNIAYSEDNPAISEFFSRGSLEWDINDDTAMFLKYEAGQFDTTGQPWVLVEPGPLSPVLMALGIGEGTGYRAAMGNNGFAPLGFPADPVLDFGSNSLFDGDTQEATIQVEHNLEMGATVTAVLGYSSYDYERFADVDMNPLPVIRFDDTEDFEQSSFELRFASVIGGRFETIGGIYYLDSNLFADGLSQFSLPTIDVLLSGSCASVPGAPAAVVVGDPVASAISVAGLAGATAATTNACAQTALTQALIPAGVIGASRYAYLDQDTESLAAFLQSTWDVSEDVRLTVGLRYTNEEKTAGQAAFATDYIARDTTPLADQSPANPAALAAFLIGEFTPHVFSPSDPGMSREENNLDWSFNAQWDTGDGVMLYGSVSTGSKAGGFNSFYMGLPQGAGAASDDVAFEDEQVLSVEVGAKMELLDGRAELNVAAFHTTYDDLQVSVFSGNTTFVVQNAAKATARGVELEGRWRPIDSVILRAAFGWLDFSYDSFANQGCVAEQFLDFRETAFQAAIAAGDPAGAGFASLAVNNQSCAMAGVNDLKGRPSAHSPDWSASLIAEYRLSLGRYELASTLDLNFSDDVYRQDDLDPVSLQKSFTKINATIAIGPERGNWDVALLGINLTDEETFSYVNDTPLFNGARQARMDQPRSVSLRGRLRF